LRFAQNAITSSRFHKSPEEITPTISDVFELLEPADPDSIKPQADNEFLLNWVKGGYTPEQLASLHGNEKISVLGGVYAPQDEPWITHRIRIKVL
jgi:hypothetical protein